MSYTRQFTGHGVELLKEMPAICDWLNANGVLPDIVPLDACVTLDRRNMTIEVYARDAKGQLVIDRERDDVVRTTVTVPLLRRPPVLASLAPARRKRLVDPRAQMRQEIARWFGVPGALLTYRTPR